MSHSAPLPEANRALDLDRQRLLALFHQAPGFVAFVRGPTHVFDLANPAYFQLVGHRDILNKPVREALPEIEGQGFFELLDRVFATGEAYVGRNVRVLVQREPGAPLTEAFVDFVYQPIRGADGAVIGMIEPGDSALELMIVDTGVGIAAEFVPHVFERFRQGDAGTTRKHGGLGLGLSIVKHLVAAHGGEIAVASEGTGTGAAFKVTLPVATTAEYAATSAESSTGYSCPPELQGLSVLVVDDEPDARDLLKELLEQCGISVRVASSGEEGLREISSACPDILISDIGMPGLDGYEFMTRVRALAVGAGGQVPAIALTAFARTQDRMRALVAGFNNHVPKPVEPMELFAVLSTLARQMRPANS